MDRYIELREKFFTNNLNQKETIEFLELRANVNKSNRRLDELIKTNPPGTKFQFTEDSWRIHG